MLPTLERPVCHRRLKGQSGVEDVLDRLARRPRARWLLDASLSLEPLAARRPERSVHRHKQCRGHASQPPTHQEIHLLELLPQRLEGSFDESADRGLSPSTNST